MTYWGPVKEWFSFKGSVVIFRSTENRAFTQCTDVVKQKNFLYFLAHAQTKVSLACRNWPSYYSYTRRENVRLLLSCSFFYGNFPAIYISQDSVKRYDGGADNVSVSQLSLFSATIREIANRHYPFIYLGLMTHAEKRKLYNLGLSITYAKVLELSTEMGNSVCALWIRCRLPVQDSSSSSLDNIDHNRSTVTVEGASHGAGISLFQHPTFSAPREEREVMRIENQPSNTKNLARLPHSCTAVRPVVLHKSKRDVRSSSSRFACKNLPWNEFKAAFSLEHKWLQQVRDELNRDITKNLANIMGSISRKPATF